MARCTVAAALIVAATTIQAASAARIAPAAGAARLVYAQTADPLDLEGKRAWIWSANPDGSDPVRLAAGTEPALSPDGRWVAFVRQRGGSASLDLIPSGGGQVRTLRVLPGKRAYIDGPTWAPNSQLIVVYEYNGRSGDLAVVGTTNAMVTVFARSGPHQGPREPSFSPDSRRIAYEVDSLSGSGIVVYDLRTRTTRQLTQGGHASDPVWGPDWLAYAELRPRATGDIWLMRGSGADRHRLTRTRSGIYPAAWSADGSRLLADNPPIHNGRLWAVTVATGHARVLTRWVGDLVAQGLSRDGTTILAAIGCGGRPIATGLLETLPFTGGKPTVVVTGPCRGSWNS